MSDKKKRILIIILCVLAVVIAIVAIAFAPFGKKATGSSDSPDITDSFEETQSVEQSSSQELSETTIIVSEANPTDATIVIPSSTDPIVNPNKNYTLFIDKTVFDAIESDDGSTSLVAKNNSSVKMNITPVRDMSYRQCCTATEKNHKKLTDSAKLDIENTNTAYRSQTGDSDSDIITTIYCVDDKKGGCIVIKCQTPVGATGYTETIEIMLSMFKVL